MAKDWARYCIFDVLTNKYKQPLSAQCAHEQSHAIKQMINCQVKQDEIDWDIAELMVNSIYRIWAQSCDQTNNKLSSETRWNWMRHC